MSNNFPFDTPLTRGLSVLWFKTRVLGFSFVLFANSVSPLERLENVGCGTNLNASRTGL